jgi:hypothetical protein
MTAFLTNLLIPYFFFPLRNPKKSKVAAPIPITIRTTAPETFIIFSMVSFFPIFSRPSLLYYRYREPDGNDRKKFFCSVFASDFFVIYCNQDIISQNLRRGHGNSKKSKVCCKDQGRKSVQEHSSR